MIKESNGCHDFSMPGKVEQSVEHSCLGIIPARNESAGLAGLLPESPHAVSWGNKTRSKVTRAVLFMIMDTFPVVFGNRKHKLQDLHAVYRDVFG